MIARNVTADPSTRRQLSKEASKGVWWGVGPHLLLRKFPWKKPGLEGANGDAEDEEVLDNVSSLAKVEQSGVLRVL